MKKSFAAFNRARGISRGFLTLALLSQASSLDLHAAETVAPPALEFASGLPGKQVRLTWAAQPGVRYRIEKSTSLGTWSQIALVESSSTNGVWLDPQPTTEKAFYRVMQPQPEVFSISSPVLSPSGGVLVLRGQAIPAGSFLRLAIDGRAPLLVPLVDIGDGFWQATTSAVLFEGEVVFTRIEDGNGVTLVTIGQPITVTATGRADDSPPSTPPAMAATEGARHNLQLGSLALEDGRMAPGPDEDCDDANPLAPLGMAINEKGLPVEKKIKKTNTPKRPGSGGVDDDCDGFDSPVALGMAIKTKGTGAAHGFADDQSSSLIAAWLSRKGYQYYMAKSDMSSAQLQNNPYFSENSNQGEMPSTRTNGGYSFVRIGLRRFYSSFAPPIGVSPAPSGLPGEVSFRSCDLSLPCPAGPPLAWVCTYRSMKPTSSGHGPGWDFSYNIRIDAANSTAPQVTVHDGGGRADVFYRQADGSYRCDGMFREGRFNGDTFMLTFADKGTWTFKPLGRSNDAGKISEISDRNGVGLTCAYDSSGQLETVSDEFGRSLTVAWGQSPPRVVSVTASAGVTLNFAKIEFTYTPQGGKRESVSVPFIPGQAPVAGPTTYAYSSSSADPRLDDNLLSITDGAGRLMEAFTYSSSAPSDIDFDTCASHDRHKASNAHVTLNRREIRPPGSSPASAYTVFEVDEIGRLTETDFDRLHRVVACREFTGFCTPGTPVTSSSNRPVPSTKVHATDPDFFETSCAYNADSCCTRITRPDGSQELTTYDRDFRRACPVRERGNARVMTLRTPGGEMRTVTCDYLPDFGTPECRTQGTPIKGISVKGGRHPGGNLAALSDKGWDGSVKGNYRKGWDGSVKGNYRKGWDGSVKGNIAEEEGGRHTPFHNKLTSASAVGGIAGGVVAGIVIAAKIVGGEQCDQGGGDDDCDGFVTRIVNAHGQSSAFGYDSNGNRTSYISALPTRGMLYQYDALGRSTRTTTLNGQGSSFIDDFAYGTDGFLSSATSDSAGLHLTTSFGRDAQGRVTSVTDPRGNSWTCAYNPLDQCIREETPAIAGTPIATKYYYDQGGCLTLCDVEHRAADGSLDLTNPAYSTYFIRDDRACLVQIASEERPVAGHINFTPTDLGIGNFAVCDITRDDAGQVIRLSTPAACRNQATDLACDFTYTERGQLHRCIEGGLGTAGAVTTEYAYDLLGAPVRCTTIGATPALSPQTLVSYDGFHRPSSTTDPNGNVTEYAYGNDGSVTTSVYGELNDVPGSAGNVLLSRATARFSSGDLGGNSNDPVCLSLPGIDRACYDLNVKSSAFFTVETEDDTVTVERFTPGSTAPTTTEVTVIDRSPAGLIQQISRNGDTLAVLNYDTAGRSITCSNGACTRTVTRNANGQILVCGDTDHFSVGGTPGKTFTMTRTFDALGRCTQVTDGVGNTSQFAFDSLSRCVSETEPGGLVIQTAYDGSSTAGAFSSRISADFDGDGSLEVLGSSLVRCGELVSTTVTRGYPTTFTHYPTTFTHDALGRCVRCDRPDGTFESTTFDSRGFVAQCTFADGSSRDVTSDLLGRATSTSWSLPPAPTSVVAVPATTMVYDGLGNLRSCVQGSSTVTAVYDSCGDQTSETRNGLALTRTFNHRGRTGITYPDGKRFQEIRNAFGELVSVSGVTPAGVVISPPIVSQEFLGHQVCRTVQRNGVTTTYTYRADGEASPAGSEDFSFGSCVRETITDASSNVLSDKLTSRDRNQRTCTCMDGYYVQSQQKTRLTVTPRDRFGNIASCVISRSDSATLPPVVESSVSYTYDLDGTRLTELRNGVADDYTKSPAPPSLDQQMGQYSTWPGGSLGWDPNGNIGTFQKGASQLTFVHDVEGRLVRVDDSTGHAVIGYGYDALGRRREQLHQSPTTGDLEIIIQFVHDGPVCIQELGTDNLADMTFVCADGIRQCISTRNGTIYYPHGGGAEFLANRGLQHWGGRAERSCPGGGRVWPQPGYSTSLITSGTGAPIERFDCDESGKPIFLTSDGLPSSATGSSIGLRWLAPACAWEPEIGMFACPGGIYSPDLGITVSKTKPLTTRDEPVAGSPKGFFNLKPH